MTLAEQLDYTRGLTRWYLSKIPEQMVKESLQLNGHQLNSAYWLAAHIAWAQSN